MKRAAYLITLLLAVCSGCRRAQEPRAAEISPHFVELHLEFVSDPLDQTLAFEPWGLDGPSLIVGDVTGDGRPEVLLARSGWVPATCHDEPRGVFYSHPVILSWDGKHFEQMNADWVGITSYSDTTSVCRIQAIPRALAVVDINADGLNEVIVGTMPYRDASQQGALYVFRWDGNRFVAALSEYCMGGVHRLDPVNLDGSEVVMASTIVHLGFGFDREADRCPQLLRTVEKSDTGLHILRMSGPDEYESQMLLVDHSSLTALFTGEVSPQSVGFIRTTMVTSSVPAMLDWSAAQIVSLEGRLGSHDIGIPMDDVPVIQIELADLDGDGADEIVVLAAKTYDGSGLVNRDEMIWRIYRMTGHGYKLQYEEPALFSSDDAIRPYYFFAVGDLGHDGRDEIVDSAGTIYSWTAGYLKPEQNVIGFVGSGFYYGLEDIYIGDDFIDGQSRIIFTGRCSDQENARCGFPRIFIVKAVQSSAP
jgi:hypothetical protein